MRYLLTPAQLAFKEALCKFLEGEESWFEAASPSGHEPSEASIRKIEDGIRAVARGATVVSGNKLSGVASVLALEELAKRAPGWKPGSSSDVLFPDSCPDLIRAASDIGAAQGWIAPFLKNLHCPNENGPSRPLPAVLSQSVADLLAEIESARLVLFRAAILEDHRKGDARESAKANRLASELAVRAAALAAEIKKGRSHETRNALQENH